MTLDEAIQHCEEVAEEKDKSVELYRAVKVTEELITKCESCAKEHRQLAEWLRELKQLREQIRWIPVSERLPEKQDCYLVTTKWKGSCSNDVYIETNMDVYREKPKEWNCKDVIAWMPLPEPYKAESEG